MAYQRYELDSVPRDATRHSTPWEEVKHRLHGRLGALAVFALLHALLVWLGYAFKTDIADPTVIWPGVGLTCAMLWLADRWFWPFILVAQLTVELLVGYFAHPQLVPGLALGYALSNALDSMVTAALARRFVGEVTAVRTSSALGMIACAAAGAFAGALTGPLVNTSLYASPIEYWQQVQMWWAGNWLGSVTVAPFLLCWLLPFRRQRPELRLRSWLELLALAGALALSVWLLFGDSSPADVSLVRLPFLTLGILIYSACRVPPRWAVALSLLVVFLGARLALLHHNSYFAGGDIFSRTIAAQTFLALCAVLALLVSTAIVEARIALARAQDSETRYRSFVEMSPEPVWRVELGQPMPVALTGREQINWLRSYGWVAECNGSFHLLQPGAVGPECRWQGGVQWATPYENHLLATDGSTFSLDGTQFSAMVDGRKHVFMAAYSGVVRDGFLLRLWCVARDITDLTDLNARLVQEQRRLRSYARQIVTAEEKARRATAVDLHDGVGQSLAGMAMTLDVARQQSSPQVQTLLEEVRTGLRDVQEHTRHMISDLSPPGLYDLGLVPALQWLVTNMREHDKLKVRLDAQLEEDTLRLDVRILAFKLVRELLRNVVKHAGVNEATVIVRGDEKTLEVQVSDEGRGFEWHTENAAARGGGFGLWSVAERVQEVGGQLVVDAAPGRGAWLTMVLPLNDAAGNDAATVERA